MVLDLPPGNGRNGGEFLSVAIGNKTLTVKGLSVLIVLFVLAIIASNLYAGFRVERALDKHEEIAREVAASQWKEIAASESRWRSEHQLMARRLDVSNCISMFTPEERQRFRLVQGAWDNLCPWMTPEPKGSPSPAAGG